MLDVYMRSHKLNMLVYFFVLNEWKVDNKNIQDLWNGLSTKDKEIFEFSMAPNNFNWNRYLQLLGPGLRLYLLKDKLDTVPDARKKFKRFVHILQNLTRAHYLYQFSQNDFFQIILPTQCL